MSEKTRNELKGYFNPGDRPTADEFGDLIDSFVSRMEDDYIKFLPLATSSLAGIVRQSTEAEMNSGADVNAYVTPLNTKNAIESLAPSLAPVQSINNQTGDVTVGLGEDSGWQTPTLLNGITNYNQNSIYDGTPFQGARYRKLNNVVYIEGMIKKGLESEYINIFNLPPSFRPSKNLIIPIVYSNIKRLDIMASGEVIVKDFNSAWISISGVSFPID